jgi:predicted  nucleic acid-binding Zn-ribbon protein
MLSNNTSAIERIEPKLNKVHEDVIKLKERGVFGDRDTEKINQRLEDVGKDVSQIKADIQTMKAILERSN